MKKSLHTAMLLATVLGLSGIPLSIPYASVTEPTIPTDEELEWMDSLNSYRRKEWRDRFKRGLTAEQREYVNVQLKG